MVAGDPDAGNGNNDVDQGHWQDVTRLILDEVILEGFDGNCRHVVVVDKFVLLRSREGGQSGPVKKVRIG